MMSFKNIKLSMLMLGLAGWLWCAPVALASTPTASLPSNVAQSATQDAVCDGIGGCSTGSSKNGAGLSKTVEFIINLLLVALGAISVIMIIIGGIKYTTSAGDSNATASAKNTIIYALVGLVIAVLAKPLVSTVLSALS